MNRIHPFNLLIVLIGLILPVCGFTQPVSSIPIDHWLTPVLTRWVIAGWAPDLSETEQPYSRDDAAAVIHSLEDVAASCGDRLSAGDLTLLERAKIELREELSVLKKRDEASGNVISNLVRRAKEFLGMQGGDGVNRLHTYFEPTVAMTRIDDRNEWNPSGTLRFGYAPFPTVAASIGIRSYRYHDRQIYPQSHWGDVASQIDDSYLRFASGNFTITFGNEKRQIGVPGLDRLLLNGSAPAFPGFDFRFSNRDFTIRYLIGQLNQGRDPRIISDLLISKYQRTLILKRVEYHPTTNWGAGFSDGIVLAHANGIGWSYLLPVPNIVALNSQPKGTEQATELVGIDGWYRIHRRTLASVEFIYSDYSHIDQSKRTPPTYGWRVGLTSVDPLGLLGTDWTIGYERIMPRLYQGAGDSSSSDRDGTRWMQQRAPLGSAFGNDFDRVNLQFHHILPYGLQYSIDLAHQRSGNRNVLDPFDNSYLGTSESARFLAPPVEYQTSCGLQMKWLSNQQWQVAGSFDWVHSENTGHQMGVKSETRSYSLAVTYFLHHIGN